MIDLPPVFLEQMQTLLGDEFPAFLSSYQRPEQIGLRANTLKITPGELQAGLPFALEPLPWSAAGFRVDAASITEEATPGCIICKSLISPANSWWKTR